MKAKAADEYIPPRLFRNGHVQTLVPPIFRQVQGVSYVRERIFTHDRDFLDLDWSRVASKRLVIISHGLEGNSTRSYVRAMVKAVNQGGWDGLAWNYRGCSGKPNLKLRSYHNSATDDLARVIDHAAQRGGQKGSYSEIALIGFSLGGNLTLVHLGRDRVDPIVSKAITFSVPCDLAASAAVLALPSNKLYMKRFLILLHQKIKEKMKYFPNELDDSGYGKIKTFKEFDDRYTAPIHGFKDAHDYWEKSASRQFIPEIRLPTLIINAVNDPFLPGECFPVAEVEANKKVTLKMPQSGGHVGFMAFKNGGHYWSEQQAVSFLNNHL